MINQLLGIPLFVNVTKESFSVADVLSVTENFSMVVVWIGIAILTTFIVVFSLLWKQYNVLKNEANCIGEMINMRMSELHQFETTDGKEESILDALTTRSLYGETSTALKSNLKFLIAASGQRGLFENKSHSINNRFDFYNQQEIEQTSNEEKIEKQITTFLKEIFPADHNKIKVDIQPHSFDNVSAELIDKLKEVMKITLKCIGIDIKTIPENIFIKREERKLFLLLEGSDDDAEKGKMLWSTTLIDELKRYKGILEIEATYSHLRIFMPIPDG